MVFGGEAHLMSELLPCNIPTFPLVARRFSQPVFGRNGVVGDQDQILVEG